MKTAAVTMLALAVALTGCATSNAAPAMPAADPTNIYEAVWQGWDGDLPDEAWIDTAAMLTCKQILGGLDPRPVPDHSENNEIVVSAAEQFVCEIDR